MLTNIFIRSRVRRRAGPPQNLCSSLQKTRETAARTTREKAKRVKGQILDFLFPDSSRKPQLVPPERIPRFPFFLFSWAFFPSLPPCCSTPPCHRHTPTRTRSVVTRPIPIPAPVRQHDEKKKAQTIILSNRAEVILCSRERLALPLGRNQERKMRGGETLPQKRLK